MYSCKDLKPGFTIAEMLLAMAVVAILTVAIVPMLKQHNAAIKSDSVASHGIIECYYDDSGNLMLYTRDNSKNPNGTETNLGTSATYCEVDVPKANYYELHVIAAGGPGGGSTDDGIKTIVSNTKLGYMITNEDNTHNETKTIAVNEDFQENLKELPPYVLDKWKKWDEKNTSVAQSFVIKTPMGSGNYSTAVSLGTYYNGSAYGQTGTQNLQYGSGNAGQSITTNPYYIKPTTQILTGKSSYDESALNKGPITVLKIEGNQNVITMTATSAKGGYYSYKNGKCNGGIDKDSCDNEISFQGNGIKTDLSNDSNVESPFSFESNLEFKYTPKKLTYKYGVSGLAGIYTTMHYEKFKDAVKLRLCPTKTSTGNSSVVKINKENTASTLYTTKDKTPAVKRSEDIKKSIGEESYDDTTVDNVFIDDLPLPKDFKDNIDALVPEETKYHEAFCEYEGSTSGLCKRTKSGATNPITKFPGRAGYGSYLYLYGMGSSSLTTIQIKSKTSSESTYDLTKNQAGEGEVPDTLECEYGNTSAQPVKYSSTKFYYCKGTEGNPGAVVLIW